MYEVVVTRSAAKSIAKLPANRRRQIASAIQQLAYNPRPPGCRRLRGESNWRIRVGDFRIIYSIDDGQLVVVILKVSPRGGAYKP